jgi:(p)ppGpp synthase/HD superfamily hydrolase
VHRYAQTNLQLYAQLQRAGWTEPMLARAARGYELALDVCGAAIRPNGKPFLCHLVGTASIVVSWGSGGDEVVCALVHSAYTHGVFADPRPGMTDEKREAVSQAVGVECEALVAAYTELAWAREAIEGYVTSVDALGASQRTAIRVRLANELEDHLDLGMCFARKTKETASSDGRDARIVLAEALVGDRFAQELRATIADTAAAHVPDVLVRDATASFRPGAVRA